ncbi:MAG: AI-2E family transporter [Candidatus Aminicenantes bacterium]|nr:AI-2E family transporter [Candidatus Aminicenantes bacterium]
MSAKRPLLNKAAKKLGSLSSRGKKRLLSAGEKETTTLPAGNKTMRFLFLGLLLTLLVLTFRLVLPYIAYLSLGLVLTIAAYPVYAWLERLCKKKGMAASLSVILTAVIIVVPTYFLTLSLAKQTAVFIRDFQADTLIQINDFLLKLFGSGADMAQLLNKALIQAQNFVVDSAISLVGSLADFIIGLFILFFTLYYGFVSGRDWLGGFREFLPLNPGRKERLIGEIQSVTMAVIYGMILGSVLHGALGGLGFYVVGLKNPVFWGFVMTILAFLPVVGPALVWMPAGAFLLVRGHYLEGIGLIVYCFIYAFLIDSVIRPRIVSDKAKIHPLVAVVGVLGGLKAFGVLGIIIGPLVAALFITMAGFFYEDYLRRRSRLGTGTRARKRAA